MKKSAALIFVIFFIVLIFTVPVIQAVIEVKDSGKIQVAELFDDVTVVPIERAKKINQSVTIIDKKIDLLRSVINKSTLQDSIVFADVNDIVNNVSTVSSELLLSCKIINRYVSSDTDNIEYSSALEIHKNIGIIKTWLEKSDQNVKDTLNMLISSIATSTSLLKKHIPSPDVFKIPWMLTKNIFELFWDSRYIRPFEKKIENNSFFALQMRPFMAFLRYFLFKDLGEKGVHGKDGYFFFRPDVQYTYKPYINESRNYANQFSNVVDPELLRENEYPVKKIVEFKTHLAEKGIDLLVVVIPGKPSVYPEKLSDFNTEKYLSPSIRFLNELKNEGVSTIDLFSEFKREKINDSLAGESLYLQKDTHWKVRGAWLAASIVAERIMKYPWYVNGDIEYVLDTTEVMRNGDVAQMTTLPNVKVNELQCTFPSEKTTCYQVSKVVRDEQGEISEKSLYKDDYSNARILLLGDSFSRIYQTDEPRAAGWISHIAYFLKQPLATIVNDGGASTIVREILARKSYLLKDKKLVIWEFVERDIRYGENGWKSVKLD